MKKDQYFPHEVNLRQTSEIMQLIDKEGMAGYGIYWGLIEYLRSQDNYTGDFRAIKPLAYQLRTTPKKLLKVLKDYNLFELYDFTFRSRKLDEVMQPLDKKRQQASQRSDGGTEEGRPRVDQKNTRNSLETSTTPDTVKESKVKESKETTSSAEVVFSDSFENAPYREPWEEYIDELDREQQWKEIMAMRSGLKLEFFTLYPRIIAGFKEHVRAFGKENNILSVSDAKFYFSSFFSPGRNTFQRLMAQLKQPSDEDDRYRFEERDPTTGQRSYCGVPIPDDAPPRPNAQAAWNDETKQWNF